VSAIEGARVLAVLGDSVDHRPHLPRRLHRAVVPRRSVASGHGVAPLDFNSYGARRGHHEVMMRGTFANIRLRNCPRRAGRTVHRAPARRRVDHDLRRRGALSGRGCAADRDCRQGVRVGSSRDWAAKGPRLLGVRAVIAESFERIHRSQPGGHGHFAAAVPPGESAASLGLTGHETFTIELPAGGPLPRSRVTVVARGAAVEARPGVAPPAASRRSPAWTARSSWTTTARAASCRPFSGAWPARRSRNSDHRMMARRIQTRGHLSRPGPLPPPVCLGVRKSAPPPTAS